MNAKLKKNIIRYFPYYKWTVYSILAVNTFLFWFVHGKWQASIDNIGWLVMLIVFEIETSELDKPYISRFEKYALRGGLILGYGLVLFAVIQFSMPSYIRNVDNLDVWNGWTWLILVAFLEYDVYAPGVYARWEWLARNCAKTVLYMALTVYAILWGLNGKSLDFWDAFIWILCFFSIEMNIFKHEDEIPYEEEMQAEAIES